MTGQTSILILALLFGVLLYQPLFGQNLSGIYTIGNVMGSEDYPTLTAAIADLKAGTIVGNVEYHIGTGTYNEPMDLSSINSGAFSITFSGVNRDLSIVHPPHSIASDQSGISITNTNNVVLKNFTLEMEDISDTQVAFALNATKGISVSGATDITLENLALTNSKYVYSESSTDYIASAVSLVDVGNISISSSELGGAGILIYLYDFTNVSITDSDFSEGKSHIDHFKEGNVLSEELTISRNTFTGPFPKDGDYGAIFLDASWEGFISGSGIVSSRGSTLLIEDNVIDTKIAGSDDAIHGINVNGWDGIVIKGNRIEDGSRGIRVLGGNTCQINSNEIYRTTNHGLYLQGSDNIDVINNVITSSHHNVSIRNLSNVRFIHNTFSANGTLSTLTTANITNLDLLNNIFHVENTVNYEVYIGEVDNLTMDYNLFSGNANTYTMIVWRLDGGYNPFNGFASFSDWQTHQALYDQNSQSFNPVFVGAGDYHITDGTNYRFGTAIADVTTDLDRDYRDPSLGIDVGADQYCNPACVAPVNPPTITSFSPASGPVGTQVTVFGSNFDEDPTNNVVYFGATQATVVSASVNELAVTVPYGATYEPITVFTNQLAVQSLTPFHVTFESNGALEDTSFDDPIIFDAGDVPRRVGTGDLDNDGRADMVAINSVSQTLSIFKNVSSGIGDINFDTKVDHTLAGTPSEILLKDFNGDGYLDIAIGYTDVASFSIFENTTASSPFGGMTFGTGQNIGTSTDSRSIASSDINADGQLDIIVAEHGMDQAIIFENTSSLGSDINFANHSSLVTGDEPRSVVFEDIDQDGKLDVIVGNGPDATISIFVKDGTSFGYAPKQDFPVGNDPINVVTGDIDEDDIADIVVSIDSDPFIGYNERIWILRNNSTPGNLSFTSSEVLTALDWIDLDDLNGDGKLDPVYMELNNGVEMRRNLSVAGNFSLDEVTGFYPEGFSTFLVTGDLDNDGEPDIIMPSLMGGGDIIEIARNLSARNDFTSFSLDEQSALATIDTENHTISIGVVDCTVPTNLIPDFTLSPRASVHVAAVLQQSGVTANDYSAPVLYVVTAEDGSTQNWTVTVNALGLPDNVAENVTTCDSYEFDGATLTTTGQYNALFANIQGCDSLVTLNLTINESDNVVENVTTCDSYEFDGATLTTTGKYNAMFTNLQGCDSLVNLNLTINGSDNVVENITACDSYEFDGATLTTSGQYDALFTNLVGCDSLVTLNLTINKSDNVIENVTACGSYEFDGTTLTTSGQYNGLFTNLQGCDSLVTLNLTINDLVEVVENVEACGSYEFDGTTLTSSGQYQGMFTNLQGCDSLVTLNLSILDSYDVEEDVQACGFYVFNSKDFFESGVYVETFEASNGCDSLVTINLTVLDEPLAEVEVNGVVLFASEIDDAAYQWYDCDSDQPLEGEDKRQLTPPRTGEYYVEVTSGECSTTSACVFFDWVLSVDHPEVEAKVFPTITSGRITIQLQEVLEGVDLWVSSVSGKIVHQQYFPSLHSKELVLNAAAGVYIVQLRSAQFTPWSQQIFITK